MRARGETVAALVRVVSQVAPRTAGNPRSDCLRVFPRVLARGGGHVLALTVSGPQSPQILGRWAAKNSVAHYLQESVAALAMQQLHPIVRCRLGLLARVGAYTNSPPPRPWVLWASFVRHGLSGARAICGTAPGESFRRRAESPPVHPEAGAGRGARAAANRRDERERESCADSSAALSDADEGDAPARGRTLHGTGSATARQVRLDRGTATR
jgi:hypothetical protein